MSSRDAIINAIRNADLPSVPLPQLPACMRYENKVEQFCNLIRHIGGQVEAVQAIETIHTYIEEKRNAGYLVLERVEMPEIAGITTKAELEKADIVVVKGRVAVAENGAIWITEKEMGERAAPFLCQTLVVVIKASDIVDTMQDAYEELAIDSAGFGVFVSGPSRTADIEQSLVIGAHGPIDLQVFILI